MPRPSTVADMPATIPVFPLQGVLLLPGARLPFNIFEPRYLALVDDALAGERTVGMIQPRVPERSVPDDRPPLHPLGCAGRIVSFEETGDGRYRIGLLGLCRFEIAEELPPRNGYRRVRADYAAWGDDFAPLPGTGIDREALAAALKAYLAARRLDFDADMLARTGTDRLVATIAMVCPFSPLEKQAVLQCRTLTERAELVVSLLTFNSAGASVSGSASGTDAPDRIN